MKNKLISLFLTMIMAMSLVSIPVFADAYGETDNSFTFSYKGITLPLSEYPPGTKTKASGWNIEGHPMGSCYAFANYVLHVCFGSITEGYTYLAQNTNANDIGSVQTLKSLFNGVTLGSHIRTGLSFKKNDAGELTQHSLIFITSNDDYIWTYESNYDGNMIVGVIKRSWNELYTYLTTIKNGIEKIEVPTPSMYPHTCPTELNTNNYETKDGILGACRECGKPYDWQSTFTKTGTMVYEIKKANKNNKVYVRTAPYKDAKECSHVVNKSFTVVGTVTNAYNNKWYVVDYSDDTKKVCYTAYVYAPNIDENYDLKSTTISQEAPKYSSGNTTSKSHTHNYNYNNGQCYCGAVRSTTSQNNAASTLDIKLTQYPFQHTQGNNFGLRGTISSNYSIKKIYGYIKQNGNIVQSTEDTPNAKSVEVKGLKLNNDLIFNNLAPGNYSLEVNAIDASGNGTTITKNFVVLAQAERADSSLTIDLDSYPVTLNYGSGYGLRGSVTSNYNISTVQGYVINSNGQTVLSSRDVPNSTYMDIRTAHLNNDLVFNNLSAGNYILKVVAADNSGKTVETSKNFSVVSQSNNSNNSSLSINLEKYPVTLNLGSSYGLRGSVTSNYSISLVSGSVINSNGQTVLSSRDVPNSTYMDIRTAHLNNDLIFNYLSAGNYIMRVIAIDASGRTVEATKDFTVKAKEAYIDNSPNGNGVTGTVSIPSNWDNLSIRTGPSTSYQIIGSMNNGVNCTVYPSKTANGWYYVEYNGIWGYASGNQINISNNTSSSSSNTRVGIVSIPFNWDDLSIRTGPSTDYQIVGGMRNGVSCTVYTDKTSNGWYYVEYNGVKGYAAGNRINLQ